MFCQKPPHQQPSDEAKNCPEQHQQADTHQEAGSPARLAQVLRHHHLVTKLSAAVSLVTPVSSDGPSFSLSVTVCPPWCVAGYWPVSLGPGILLSRPLESPDTEHSLVIRHQGTQEIIPRNEVDNKNLEGFDLYS